MKRIVISFLMGLALVSCDYVNDTSICNQTDQEIQLRVTFDLNVITNWSGGMEPKNFIKNFHHGNESLILMEADTLNYISTYSIVPNTCGNIEGSTNRRPNFIFFEELEIIIKSDTLRLQTKEEMRKAFDADRKEPKGVFQLLILKDGKISNR